MGRFFIYLFGTFFGTGYAPIAPATAASLAFTVVWGLASPVPMAWRIGLLVLVCVLGVPAATWLEKRHGKDPHLVVCDEIAGMIVTFILLRPEPGWTTLLAGFFWFRVFDILKPWPVRKLESLPRGWGIMADDVMAGVYSCAFLGLTVKVLGW